MRRWGRRSRRPAARPPTPSSGVATPRRARRLHRQGQGRSARPGVCPRHPRRRRGVHDAAGRRRRIDRALLRAGDARRRAHHEHLSRRRAGSASSRHRCRHDRGERHHLSRRLSVGSEERQGRVRQSGEDRARGRAQGGADSVGCVLRRSLACRVSASDALAHRRSDFRQRGRAAQPVSDRGLRHRGEGPARRCRRPPW